MSTTQQKTHRLTVAEYNKQRRDKDREEAKKQGVYRGRGRPPKIWPNIEAKLAHKRAQAKKYREAAKRRRNAKASKVQKKPPQGKAG